MAGDSDGVGPLLRGCYEAGAAAHPQLELPADAFEARLRVLLERRLASAASGTPEEWVRELPPGDYFLASACELDVPGAWERLHEAYESRIRAMAVHWGASAADAHDVASGFAGELVPPPASGHHRTKLGAYDGTGSLLGYVFRIVRHKLADGQRRRRPEANTQLDGKPDSGESPYEVLVLTETGHRVASAFEDALVDLNPTDFELLKLHFSDGVAQAEIARRLEVTPPRVHYRLHRCLDRIRESVLQSVPDETAGYWLSRKGQAAVLKDVIARILESGRDPRR